MSSMLVLVCDLVVVTLGVRVREGVKVLVELEGCVGVAVDEGLADIDELVVPLEVCE